MAELKLVQLHNNEPMTTSLAIAEGVQMDHATVLKLLRKHVEQLSELGGVGFEIQPFDTNGGQQWRDVYFLNEQQATLLITFMRNTEIVIRFKVALVKAFFELRDQRAANPHRNEPLTLSHRADIQVQAARTFQAMLRAARAAGLPMAKALREANGASLKHTGVDMLAEMHAEDLPEQREAEKSAPKPPADVFGVHAFAAAWESGALPVPFVVCRSSDLYDAYAIWYRDQSRGYLATTQSFFRRLQDCLPRAAKTMARIRINNKSHVVRIFVPESGSHQPGALIREQVQVFRAALDQWTMGSAI
jgi:phage regulator Rha-like protein